MNATQKAIDLAVQYGGIDGSHHKDWVIDQMVRALPLLVTDTNKSLPKRVSARKAMTPTTPTNGMSESPREITG